MERVVCLNCMDGRAQLPVIHWIKENHSADYVDMVTEPGMDGLLAGNDHSIEAVIGKARISIERNNAQMIFVAGHHDCRGNPVSDAEHQKQIRLAVSRLKKEFPQMDTIGLWVDEKWQARMIS